MSELKILKQIQEYHILKNQIVKSVILAPKHFNELCRELNIKNENVNCVNLRLKILKLPIVRIM